MILSYHRWADGAVADGTLGPKLVLHVYVLNTLSSILRYISAAIQLADT